jgi:uncharacterized Zn-binding protein involved in type VI secretion
MSGQGRLGDKANITGDAHGCPGCPHVATGPAISGSPDVFVNGRPALRVDDVGVAAPCCGPNMWHALKGAPTVFINGKAAFRMNDPSRHCGGTGRLIEGSSNVIVGDASSGGGGGGGGGGDSARGGSGSRASGGDHATATVPTRPAAAGNSSASRPAAKSDGPFEVRIRVIDEATGNPIGGVRFEVFDGDQSIGSGYAFDDGTGHYPVPAQKSYTVRVYPETAPPKPNPQPNPDNYVYKVVFKLVDEDSGAALEGAPCQVLAPNGSVVGNATSDNDGVVTCDVPTAGSYKVQVSRPSAPAPTPNPSPTPNPQPNPPTAYKVAFKLVDESSGAAAKGLSCRVLAADGSVAGEATTGDDGVVSCNVPAAGSYQVQVKRPADNSQ